MQRVAVISGVVTVLHWWTWTASVLLIFESSPTLLTSREDAWNQLIFLRNIIPRPSLFKVSDWVLYTASVRQASRFTLARLKVFKRSSGLSWQINFP